MFAIANFYRFVQLENLPEIRNQIDQIATEAGLVGTVLLAEEGINGGFAGPDRDVVQNIIDQLAEISPNLRDLAPKWTSGASLPYKWLEVKIKKAIVTFTDNNDPDINAIVNAPRLTPSDYDRLINEQCDEVIVVDTRNDYEFEYGHFANAVDLGIKKFRDFPEAFERRFANQKDRTFVFFCTGGIRCEKAVPWAIERGFKNVFQIEGGILSYLEHHRRLQKMPGNTTASSDASISPQQSQWEGNCFVFDQRWAIDGQLSETDHNPPQAVTP